MGETQVSSDLKVQPLVKVCDERGIDIPTDNLKKGNLLLVYWKEPLEHSITITVYGTMSHCSLVEFDRLDLVIKSRGFFGKVASHYLDLDWGVTWFSWPVIDRIVVVGSSSLALMLFVDQVFVQKDRAERDNLKLRHDITGVLNRSTYNE